MGPEDQDFINSGVDQIADGLFGPSDEPEDPPLDDAPIVDEAPPVTAAPTVRSAPQSWPKEYHEHWSKLEPKVQEFFERREQDFHKGLSQYKEHHEFGKNLREVFAPYKQMIESQGLDEAKAAQFLLNAHSRLATLPQEQRLHYLAQIASNYGIQIPGVSDQQQQADPRVQHLESAVQQILRAQHEEQTRKYNDVKAKVESDVAAFADAKDEHNNPKHPYFNDVADDIIPFLNAGASLQDAYDKAVWANPVTRAKEQARLKTEAEKSLRERSKTEAHAAAKASSANVRNRDTRKAPTEPVGKMEDTMKETLADIKARAH